MGILRPVLFGLSKSSFMQNVFAHFPPAKRFARRFVAGEKREEGLQVAKRLEAQGLKVTLDHLGEDVTEQGEADHAARHYVELVDAIAEKGLDASISIKLSQIGLAFDSAFCKDHLFEILGHATEKGVGVEIDMEGSQYTEDTLQLYHEAVERFENVAVCVQANLKRTEDDLAELIEAGGSVRLVKGAYQEPGEIAFQDKKLVDTNYVNLLHKLLSAEAIENGVYPLIATHDASMIDVAKERAAGEQISKDQFDFQLLHGIHNDYKQQLVEEEYTVRVYVPYGAEWYPYFMRRLAERPANLFFLLKHVFK